MPRLATPVYVTVSVKNRLPKEMGRYFCIIPLEGGETDERQYTFYPAKGWKDKKARWIDVPEQIQNIMDVKNGVGKEKPTKYFEHHPIFWLERQTEKK